MKIIKLSLVLVLIAFGCSKKEAVTDLGVIELVRNVPKHINVGGMDWTITEELLANGKHTITAKSAGLKVTQKDISDSRVPPDAKIGYTFYETADLTSLPTGVEVTGYFGKTLTRYTLKHDAN